MQESKPPSFGALYEEIRRLPEGTTGEILEPGILRTMSRPGRAHARVQRQLFRALAKGDRDAGGAGWWFELEPEIVFPLKRLAVPDVAGWRCERVEALPDENPLTVIPDWCCEIISPSTRQSDRQIKLPLYVTSGVGWVWLVDPEAKLVEVFESVAGRPTLAATGANDAAVMLPPFDFEFHLGTFWMPT
jgi:Uma2 family endonuclease